MLKLWRSLNRRKTINDGNENKTKLARVLTLNDLTALGVGSTLGLGVYILAGSVAFDKAGPAVTLSFLIAAIASAFSGICYAEFAGRVPTAGSAYVYSYVTIGEFVAFSIGWNLILEYIIGTASIARGLSGYFDSLIDNKISKSLTNILPINVRFLGTYPDFLAFSLVILVSSLLSFGVKKPSLLNNIFTMINLLTIGVVLIAGGINANVNNWFIPKDQVPFGFGNGGFMPFGFAGVIRGAAKCFYGFVGFDCIAAMSEEAINPQHNIPLAIVISLIIIFFSYFGVSTVLTMMLPYYAQNPSAPLPSVFESINWITIKWIVIIGGVFALCTSLLGAMFPLPRILYSMGNDGVLFKKLAKVNNYTQTPLLATIISGIVASFMALIFDLDQLIDMMSIGTLLAYTIVAICVLVLRYQSEEPSDVTIITQLPIIIKQFWNGNSLRKPSALSSTITKTGVILFTIVSIIWCSLDKIYEFGSTASIIALSIICVVLIIILAVISMQPVLDNNVIFRVPLVPFIPCLSVFVNLYLMFQLDVFTWIRFIIWITLGYLIYFAYGVRYSTQIVRSQNKTEVSKS